MSSKTTQPSGIQFPCSQQFRDKVLIWFITSRGSELSIADAAEFLGVPLGWLNSQLVRLGLRAASDFTPNTFSRQENELSSLNVVRSMLAQEYIKEERSSNEIATMLGASSSRVVDYVRRAGLSPRTHQQAVVIAGIKRRIEGSSSSLFLRAGRSLTFDSGDERSGTSKDSRPEEKAEANESKVQLEANLNKLSETHPLHGRVIKYVFFLEQSPTQIATLEGCSEDDVLRIQQEAIALLRKGWGEG